MRATTVATPISAAKVSRIPFGAHRDLACFLQGDNEGVRPHPVRRRPHDSASVWPEALALPCPACAHVFPLEGMLPNATLFFRCSTHDYFMVESWSSPVERVNPHLTYPWTTELDTRLEFMSSALEVFLRSGREEDALILQGATGNDSVLFHHLPGGDGQVATDVNARIKPCSVCPTRPLSDRAERVLFDLGFDPPFGPADEGPTYWSDSLPAAPEQLAAISETVFRQAYELPEDCGILARFKQPAMAETFYLEWTFRRTV